MNRQEQREQAALDYCNNQIDVKPTDVFNRNLCIALGQAYLKGAEWADDNPSTDIIERDSISFCRMLLIKKFNDIAKGLAPQDIFIDNRTKEIHDMIVNFDKACEFAGYKLNEDNGIYEKFNS